MFSPVEHEEESVRQRHHPNYHSEYSAHCIRAGEAGFEPAKLGRSSVLAKLGSLPVSTAGHTWAAQRSCYSRACVRHTASRP